MSDTQNQQLVHTVDNLSGRQIVVLGDLILDEFVWGSVDRISPEAPVPVIQVSDQGFRLGGAANVASNLAALGAEPILIGVAGDDWAGKRLREELENRGIDSSRVVIDDSRPTTIKTRIIAHHQQVCRTDRESRAPLGHSVRLALEDRYRSVVREESAVILSDYAKGVLSRDTTLHLIELARGAGAFVAVDPKVHHFSVYRGASIVTPNSREAESATGIEIRDDASAREAGQKLRQNLESEYLLLTRGDRGMILFDESGHHQIPTVAREVFDVTGAGDTVIAVMTAAVAAGATVFDAALIANCAAGIVVGKLGTATPSRSELREMLSRAED